MGRNADFLRHSDYLSVVLRRTVPPRPSHPSELATISLRLKSGMRR